MITKSELAGLKLQIDGFARANNVMSVHAFKVCMRHLETAKWLTADARHRGVEMAYTHFQFLKAAAAEKATRGR